MTTETPAPHTAEGMDEHITVMGEMLKDSGATNDIKFGSSDETEEAVRAACEKCLSEHVAKLDPSILPDLEGRVRSHVDGARNKLIDALNDPPDASDAEELSNFGATIIELVASFKQSKGVLFGIIKKTVEQIRAESIKEAGVSTPTQSSPEVCS